MLHPLRDQRGSAPPVHVHVQWLARGNDTVLGNTSDPREFFLTRECENVLISDVSKVNDNFKNCH